MDTIENWFETVFNKDVHHRYQQMGSKVRGTVRTDGTVKGEKAEYRLYGKAEVGDKVSGGEIPIANPKKDKETINLYKKYLGIYVDDLDALKHNINERMGAAKAAVAAHSRYTDSILVAAFATTTKSVGDYSTGLTKTLIQGGFEMLNGADVPDDGERYALIGAHQWEELLNIDAFAKSDYVGDKYPWLQGADAKRWRNTLWIMHSGLPLSGTQRSCFLYHKSAAAHAIGRDVVTKWSWENDKDQFLLNTNMMQGAGLIEDVGMVELKCKENTTL
jgi:hypothetical protein